MSTSTNPDNLTGKVKINGKEPGDVYPQVRDQYYQMQDFHVTVRDTKLILSTELLELNDSNYAYISAQEAHTGIQTVMRNNDNVDILLTMSGDQQVIQVSPVHSGETILEVTDYEGNKAWVRVVVNTGGNVTDNLGIKNVMYTSSLTTQDIGGVYFEATGDYDEVGMMFTRLDGTQDTYTINKQIDGVYVVAFSQESCEGCNDFTPYIQKGSERYFATTKTFVIAYGGDTISTAGNESGVEINSQGYVDFRMYFNYIWNTFGYNNAVNRAGNKVVDIKNDMTTLAQDVSKDVSVSAILNIIAAESIHGVDIGYVNVQTFPVAGYMLNKFLNGPEGDEVYDTDHWISKKLKQTSNYNVILELIGDKNNYTNLSEGETILVESSSSLFGQTFYPISDADLYFGIKKYEYKLYVMKEKGELYSIVKFSDDYDFPKDAEYGDGLGDTLNALGYYYQTNLKGEVYHWDSIIKGIIK